MASSKLTCQVMLHYCCTDKEDITFAKPIGVVCVMHAIIRYTYSTIQFYVSFHLTKMSILLQTMLDVKIIEFTTHGCIL